VYACTARRADASGAAVRGRARNGGGHARMDTVGQPGEHAAPRSAAAPWPTGAYFNPAASIANAELPDEGKGNMSDTPRIIKKYPNRRLYDTATSTYITLVNVKQLVLEQTPFQVIDAKTNDDLTRNILLQIILDEENSEAPMFSSDVLSQMIRFYGNTMQGMMGSYLEKNIQTFMGIQQQLQDQSRSLYGSNPMVNTDAWNQIVKMQGPAVQSLMSGYLEQSAKMFVDMQQQMQKQTQNMFSGFPFPGFGGASGSKPEEK
jgi:polyhydroxyalkanoate synthesis repressor PhaR